LANRFLTLPCCQPVDADCRSSTHGRAIAVVKRCITIFFCFLDLCKFMSSSVIHSSPISTQLDGSLRCTEKVAASDSVAVSYAHVYIYMCVFFKKNKNLYDLFSKKFPHLQAACRGGELPVTDSRPMCQKGYGAAARDRLKCRLSFQPETRTVPNSGQSSEPYIKLSCIQLEFGCRHVAPCDQCNLGRIKYVALQASK
jgi:hypothetical protein